MAVAANDLMMVTYWSRLSAQQLMTVLHYRVETAPTAVADETFWWTAWAEYFGTAGASIYDAYIACTPGNVYIERVTVQRVSPTRGVYAEQAIDSLGAYAGTAPTPNVCASITKRSYQSGRTGVGHTQWPPLAPVDYNDGLIDDDFKTGLLLDLANAIEEPVTIGTGTGLADLVPCLPAGGANENYDVWQTGVRSQVRTMHRRTVGLGI